MKKLVAALVAALALSACSGGGGYGGASIPAVPSASIAQPAQSVARTPQDGFGGIGGFARISGGGLDITASVSGKVQNKKGGAVAGAVVSAKLLLTRVSATTDANGNFTLPSLASGTYSLSVDNTNAQGQTSTSSSVAGPTISVAGANITGVIITD